VSSLYAQAIRYLSIRDHSRAQLRTKLLRGSASGQVDEVLDRLGAERLLDDARYALNRALYQRRHKHWGDRKIAAYLKSQGVEEWIIRSTLSELEGESSQAEALDDAVNAWVRKSGKPRVPAQLRRLRDHCLRLGYPSALVSRLLLRDYSAALRKSSS
jgi:regulatory protein